MYGNLKKKKKNLTYSNENLKHMKPVFKISFQDK